MDFSFIKLPKGIQIRKPYQSELDYFLKNKNVGGMATQDNKVILNPYAKLKPEEFQSVAANESARLIMKQDESMRPDFALTPEQIGFLDSTTYKQANQLDRNATIAARILSGDPSAGKPTQEQLDFVEKLKQQMYSD
jgi:hypothetical protein